LHSNQALQETVEAVVEVDKEEVVVVGEMVDATAMEIQMVHKMVVEVVVEVMEVGEVQVEVVQVVHRLLLWQRSL
jgi:hypothetical protein